MTSSGIYFVGVSTEIELRPRRQCQSLHEKMLRNLCISYSPSAVNVPVKDAFPLKQIPLIYQ